jgi:hypothetical protein
MERQRGAKPNCRVIRREIHADFFDVHACQFRLTPWLCQPKLTQLQPHQGYTLTLNGEPLARMVPIRRRRAVPKDEVLAIFATAPVLDADDLRADLDEAVSQDVRDPYEGAGL